MMLVTGVAALGVQVGLYALAAYVYPTAAAPAAWARQSASAESAES